MNIGQRLKEIRENLRLSQEDFGLAIGLTKSAISAVENNKSNLSQTVLSRMVLDLNINANYLLAGIGEPFLNNSDKNPMTNDSKLYEKFKQFMTQEGML